MVVMVVGGWVVGAGEAEAVVIAVAVVLAIVFINLCPFLPPLPRCTVRCRRREVAGEIAGADMGLQTQVLMLRKPSMSMDKEWTITFQ